MLRNTDVYWNSKKKIVISLRSNDYIPLLYTTKDTSKDTFLN